MSSPDKGKPTERRGRKAEGLNPEKGHDSLAAEGGRAFGGAFGKILGGAFRLSLRRKGRQGGEPHEK